ncbi:hypothetical protein HDK77DRAFT_278075 [Phyllosticta capitalensis]|uniref:uncharacterized protein n=1 Tax=Phyllosticta capitalensis TaxID=121624 RepID=UPI00312DFAB4
MKNSSTGASLSRLSRWLRCAASLSSSLTFSFSLRAHRAIQRAPRPGLSARPLIRAASAQAIATRVLKLILVVIVIIVVIVGIADVSQIWHALALKVLRMCRMEKRRRPRYVALQWSPVLADAAAARALRFEVSGIRAGRGGAGGCGTPRRGRPLTSLAVLIDRWRLRKALFRRRWNAVWQRYVARGTEATDIGAVFVLNAKYGPHASAEDFRQADEERENSRVLQVIAVDCVKNPIESQDWIQENGDVVHPDMLVAEIVAEEWSLGLWIQQT